MNKIVVKNDFAFLYLDKNFYRLDCIKNALIQYKDFFSAEIKELGNYLVITIKKLSDEYTYEILSREFLNYILSVEFQMKK